MEKGYIDQQPVDISTDMLTDIYVPVYRPTLPIYIVNMILEMNAFSLNSDTCSNVCKTTPFTTLQVPHDILN